MTVLLWAACPPVAGAQSVDYSKSYINVSKRVSGGTIQPGDILEIRFTLFVRNGIVADSCAVYDNIPANTTLQPDSMILRTNEGLQFRPRYTNALDGDPGTVTGGSLRIHMGTGATAERRGRITGATDKPRFYTVGCIIMATYRVRVNPAAPLNTIINIGGGSLTYKLGTASITTVNFPVNNIILYANNGFCVNSTGANSISNESNGTFGSGRNKNRGPSPVVPANYTYTNFGANTPNDYYYGVANNTSGNYATSNSLPYPDGANRRVFQVWDIIGDHTNAAVPASGNPATDTVPASANGGYMAIINASYRTDSAFSQVISNLCPNTYYEFSAWFYNICRFCACDSNGRGAFGSGFNGPDSSGVNPNLTFKIDGLDYYSTGNMTYTRQWIKKGFTYLTGPSQTSMRVTIRNNAPGGGGNDWAIDDISVRLCGPDISFASYPLLTVCDSNEVIGLSATVRSFFNNYIHYVWERSTDNGATWSSTGISGTGTPVLTGGMHQYTVTYPPFVAYPADSGHRYRLKVATTAGNLTNASCSYVNSSQNTLLNVINCYGVLPVNVSQLRAYVNGGVNTVAWSTSAEYGPMRFEVERSGDGLQFALAAVENGRYRQGPEHAYTFADAQAGGRRAWYRLKITDSATGSNLYSNIAVTGSTAGEFELLQVTSPFNHSLQFNCMAAETGTAAAMLYDAGGGLIQSQPVLLRRGHNEVDMPAACLKSGIYILRVLKNGETAIRRVIKY